MLPNRRAYLTIVTRVMRPFVRRKNTVQFCVRIDGAHPRSPWPEILDAYSQPPAVRRCVNTVLQAPSTIPDPIGKPIAVYTGDNPSARPGVENIDDASHSSSRWGFAGPSFGGSSFAIERQKSLALIPKISSPK